MGELDPDQIRTGLDIGDLFVLVDTGGGTPGLPAIDASLLVNIPAAAVHGTLSGLGADDHLQYLLLAGRATGQQVFGGTGVSEELALRGTTNANLGLIRAQSPIIFDDVIAAASLSPYFMAATPAQSTSALFVGGGYNASPTIVFGHPVSIWEGFRISPVISSSVNLGFAAFTLLQALPRCTSAVSGRNPMNVLTLNNGPVHEYTNSFGSVQATTIGMNWSPQIRATASGGTISWVTATCLQVSPKFSTVPGSVVNLGPIRGVHGINPAVALFQTGGGFEVMSSFILIDMNNITFGGNVTKAAVRSAQAAATNAFFLLQTGTAQSRFVGEVQHRSNTRGSKWGTADQFGIRFNGTQAEFEWAGGDSLRWQNIPAFNYWRVNNATPQGLQWDVEKMAFGDIAPLLTRNWFTAFFPRARSTNFAGEWTDIVFQATSPVTLAHNVTTLAAWVVRESQIIRGGFGLDVACTLWVDTVPTEGDRNYGVYAPNGRNLVKGYHRRSAAYAGYA